MFLFFNIFIYIFSTLHFVLSNTKVDLVVLHVQYLPTVFIIISNIRIIKSNNAKTNETAHTPVGSIIKIKNDTSISRYIIWIIFIYT